MNTHTHFCFSVKTRDWHLAVQISQEKQIPNLALNDFSTTFLKCKTVNTV